MSIGLLIPGKGRHNGVGVGRIGAGPTGRECGGRPGMRKIMTLGRSAGFALAIASIAGAAPGIAQDAPKFDCARLAPLMQRQAREMSTLLPDIENAEVQTTLERQGLR
jgi:hypothetical protein